MIRRLAKRLARETSGVALVFTVAAFFFLFVLVLSVYSVGETIRRKTELQDACDAAAYSAAVVQADALSRMAVVNRAMAWSYIQMTKAELDYYTYLWLERVRECYANDASKCLSVSRSSSILSPLLKKEKAGYWHSKTSWLHDVLRYVKFIDFYLNIYSFGLSCHEGVHDNPGDDKTYSKARWIGLGWDKPNRIRIGFETGGELEWDGSDLRLPDADEGLVEPLKEQFGEHGTKLQSVIRGYQKDILACNQLLYDIRDKMDESIQATVRRTLLENLPRTSDGKIDESLLSQYRYASLVGVSKPPPEYVAMGTESSEGGEVDDDSRRAYFSGVFNVEEDELRFLNMADGLPRRRTGLDGTATLKDWFADDDAGVTELGKVREMAGGLDQWFIRCFPQESTTNVVSFDRKAPFSIPGIVRSYKNANYDEGRSTGSILGGVAGKFNADVHRGNHVFPGAPQIAKPNFAALFRNSSANPGDSVPIPGGWLKRKIRKAQKRYREKINSKWSEIQGMLVSVVTAPLAGLIDLVNGEISQLCSLDIDPSCKNEQRAFADQCSNVGETHGLVAEYEWATAWWLCGWCKKNGSVVSCFHIPVPVGLAFGSMADSYGKGLFSWLSPELKNFKGEKGFARSDYHTTFIGLNTDTTENCSRGMLNGRGANTILKAYARIYGDDREIVSRAQTVLADKYAYRAQPWFLNEKFFAGEGTILVAVAKEQRNVFDWLADKIEGQKSLHAAFSPGGEGEEKKTVWYVAMAAGRAGPARRKGDGLADGPDTENDGVAVPRYEVAWNSVTDKTLGPSGQPRLAKGNDALREQLEKAWAKEGHDLEALEREHRWGCACGEADTDRRLRRQWNLSQTDWDGMLLPLRHAFSLATNDTGAATAPADATWPYDATGSPALSDEPAGIVELVRQIQAPSFQWYRFDEPGAAPESSQDILGEALNLPLFRLRRLL